MKAIDVAKYIVNRCIKNEHPISNIQLQKLLYFVQLKFLQTKREFLIDEEFEAWRFGPVIREVYDNYCLNGAYLITTIQKEDELVDKNSLHQVDGTIDHYSNDYPWNLAAISHRENGAWYKVYHTGMYKPVIPKESILEEALAVTVN